MYQVPYSVLVKANNEERIPHHRKRPCSRLFPPNPQHSPKSQLTVRPSNINVLNADHNGRDIIRIIPLLSCHDGLFIIIIIIVIFIKYHDLLLHDTFVVAIEWIVHQHIFGQATSTLCGSLGQEDADDE